MCIRDRQVTDAEAEKVRAVGGLFILGTERHESRRIDNHGIACQVINRSGNCGSFVNLQINR